MEYTKLGTSDLTVSRICLGCMAFGDENEEAEGTWGLNYDHSRAIVKQALDAGITFFDTAIVYHKGASEQYLGRAVAELANRDDVVIATKFPVRSDAELEQGVSAAEHVRANLDQSLANLGMDYVDLYICHMWDYRTDMYQVLEAMSRAVDEGKVRALGISNCYAWQLAKLNAYAAEHGLAPIVSIQSHYNLIAREDERELVPLCREDDIAMTPYSALAGGRLSRLPGHGSTRRLAADTVAHLKYDGAADQDAQIVARVAELAERHGASMSEVALAWLLARVTSPVVGATKVSHVDGAVTAVDLKLTEEELAYLEEPYTPHELVGVMAWNKPGTGQFKTPVSR